MGITSVRIQDDISKQLEAVAANLHRTKSSLINQAIKEFLEQQKQEQRWNETLDALESVRTGRIASGKDVHHWLESWGSEQELAAPKMSKSADA